MLSWDASRSGRSEISLELSGRAWKTNGGSGRNRTGVDGFAGRCITTLLPSHEELGRSGDPAPGVSRLLCF